MKRGALLCAFQRWQIRGSHFGKHFCVAHSTAASPSQDPKLSNDSRSIGADPYDVVIVGGGMVGAAVGCGLASSHLTSSLRVAIVDGNPGANKSYSPPPRHAIPDSRVWDYSGKGFTRYEAADVGEDVLGYVVENNVLISSLRIALQSSNGAEFICPAQVKKVQFPSHSGDNSWAQVLLEDGRMLQSRLVVGADGSKSKVRAMAGVKTTGWDYHQHALICTVRVSNPHSTAWQRFLPTGPLALLPMGDHFSNIVWSTSPEKAKELKAMSPEDFLLAINDSLNEKHGIVQESQLARALTSRWLSPLLGENPGSASEPFQAPPVVTECLTPRLSFPLSLQHANHYVSTRLALVGDAAHTVHPLAGQGVNLGFGDAASLLKTIANGVETGADIGQLALLKRYEKERMWANVPMMAILDGFQRVFSADFLPINLARAVGFSAANYVAPLKKQIISFAMGR